MIDDEVITKMLLHAKIPSHLSGFHYLRTGVQLYKGRPFARLVYDIYPLIAAEYATASTNVERCIRNAIRQAWERGMGDVLELNQRPTNGEFMMLIMELLNVQYSSSM
ncbi:sporulation initiation factor Spo0A C-terminal domain-containing protein [Christensenellaceae bacterium OttesenSCG-928-M15]|nr:sporulation initiation factor Spo0A C-terminal domain-containing protein [Christensenellaceae bacterium OttesenSCG-928-M15]